MHHARLLAIFLVTLTPLTPVLAQEVFIDEDFESQTTPGIPRGWSKVAAPPFDWYTGFPSTNGCMPAPPATSAASGVHLLANNELWNPGVCGIRLGGRALSETVPILPGENYRVSFDYYLDIDVQAGDTARVSFANWQVGAPNPVPIASNTNGLQLATWAHLEVDIPASALTQYVGTYDFVALDFRLKAAMPSTHAGLALDNIHVSTAPHLSFTQGCDQSGQHDLDGDGTPDLWCPCFNFGQAGAGCANSTALGAAITPAGSDRISDDDLTIGIESAPPGRPAILVLGNVTSQPFVSGAGILCLSSPLVRLGVRSIDGNGIASWGGNGFLTGNGWSAGTTLSFMVQYRDAGPGTCSGTLFNWSNSTTIVLGP